MHFMWCTLVHSMYLWFYNMEEVWLWSEILLGFLVSSSLLRWAKVSRTLIWKYFVSGMFNHWQHENIIKPDLPTRFIWSGKYKHFSLNIENNILFFGKTPMRMIFGRVWCFIWSNDDESHNNEPNVRRWHGIFFPWHVKRLGPDINSQHSGKARIARISFCSCGLYNCYIRNKIFHITHNVTIFTSIFTF